MAPCFTAGCYDTSMARLYSRTVTAYVEGYITALQDTGHLLKDVNIDELDYNYVLILRNKAKAKLTGDNKTKVVG